MKLFVKTRDQVLAMSTITMLLVGCGAGPDESSSQTKVTNGRDVTEADYPATVLLVMQQAKGQAICTGTFVNDSQLVTAGHCVEGQDFSAPQLYYVSLVQGQYQAKSRALSIQRNPSYSIDLGVSPYDAAVVTFPAQTAPAIVSVSDIAPKAGDSFTIVGYGNNENKLGEDGQLSGTGAGIKRAGGNTISEVSDGFITFSGVPGRLSSTPLGSQVSAGSGDSGGPLFVNGSLAGVTSGGGLQPVAKGVYAAVSFYVDLNSSSQSSFLKTALKKKDAA